MGYIFIVSQKTITILRTEFLFWLFLIFNKIKCYFFNFLNLLMDSKNTTHENY